MQYELRLATEADFEFAHTLRRETMRDYALQAYGAWDDEEQRGFSRAAFNTESMHIILIAGQPVGLVSGEERESALYLRQIFISPSHQCHGIGADTVRGLVGRAASKGLPLELKVLNVNERARALYERLGLRITAEADTHYLMST